MSASEKATKAIEALQTAQREPSQDALPILNGLVGLIRDEPDQPLEIEEPRANAFMAICEVAKALHRGMPADHLWTSAIGAAERWRALV